MPEDAQLVLDLKKQAQQAGFVLCEICPTTTPTHYERYQDWLAQGYQAEMAYLATPEAQARRLMRVPFCPPVAHWYYWQRLIIKIALASPLPQAPQVSSPAMRGEPITMMFY
jgi:epoxyqueuosine reductase QueG